MKHRRSPAMEIVICLAVIVVMGLAFIAGLLSARGVGEFERKTERALAGPSR